MITGRQVRAARALLGMDVEALGQRAGVSPTTITRFENGLTKPIRSTLTVLQKALEDAGIEFMNSDAPGVRLRKRS